MKNADLEIDHDTAYVFGVEAEDFLPGTCTGLNTEEWTNVLRIAARVLDNLHERRRTFHTSEVADQLQCCLDRRAD